MPILERIIQLQYTVGGTEEDYREDLIWTLEHFFSVERARNIDDEFGISGLIGLTQETDRILVWCYLAQRLMRIDVSNLNQQLEHPPGWYSLMVTGVDPMKYQLFKDVWERKLKENESFLQFLEGQTNEYVENVYSSTAGSHRAREIELAINYLVALATSGQIQEAEIKFRPEHAVLRTWGEKWSDRLESTPRD